MKKIILSIAAVAMIVTGTMAQATVTKATTTQATKKGNAPRETPEAKAKSTVTKLTAELGLKPDQVTSATKIFTDFFTQVSALRSQSSSLDEKALDEKKKELKKNRNASLKAILTAEQQAKFQEIMKEKKASKGTQRDASQQRTK